MAEVPEIYSLELMDFDEWAHYVEKRWGVFLVKSLGIDGARVAMTIHRSMLAGCADEAYKEYEQAWKRHEKHRQRPSVQFVRRSAAQ